MRLSGKGWVATPAPALFLYKAATSWAIPPMKGADGKRMVFGLLDNVMNMLGIASYYQVLLKARTGATAELIVEIGAKADLLTTDTPRFISGDDPVW